MFLICYVTHYNQKLIMQFVNTLEIVMDWIIENSPVWM